MLLLYLPGILLFLLGFDEHAYSCEAGGGMFWPCFLLVVDAAAGLELLYIRRALRIRLRQLGRPQQLRTRLHLFALRLLLLFANHHYNRHVFRHCLCGMSQVVGYIRAAISGSMIIVDKRIFLSHRQREYRQEVWLPLTDSHTQTAIYQAWV